MLTGKIAFAGIAIFVLAFATPTFADHLRGKIDNDIANGGIVISKSFKKNWFFYKSIGGNTSVKGKVKKREWWCAWLCKRRKNKKAELITIQNTYYAEVSPGVFSDFTETRKECQDASSCTQKQTFVGFLPKQNFPGDIDTEIVGVITRHTIRVDGQSFIAMTSTGRHPEPGPRIIQ